MPDIDPRLVAALDEAAFAAARDSTATLAAFLRDDRVRDWLAERLTCGLTDDLGLRLDFGEAFGSGSAREYADAILGREP